jgi:hypothetical protein
MRLMIWSFGAEPGLAEVYVRYSAPNDTGLPERLELLTPLG